MTQADSLYVLSSAQEFAMLKLRQEELGDLEKLTKVLCPIEIKQGITDHVGKSNALIQAFISRGLGSVVIAHSPTLMNDVLYVQQNLQRICRAVFELVRKRHHLPLSLQWLQLCQQAEQQLWPFQHPLHQIESVVSLVFSIRSSLTVCVGGIPSLSLSIAFSSLKFCTSSIKLEKC